MRARRWWGWPGVPLYAAAIAVKDILRAGGVLKVRKLAWPVVSVGSLSAGGAGKTPVVIALAKLLKEHGWDVDVLSRGYGRTGVGIEQVGDMRKKQIVVNSERRKKKDTLAKRFGDEPVMIARAADVPVWVGSDRFEAGVRAEEFMTRQEEPVPFSPLADVGIEEESRKSKGSPGVHILDDGFQHSQLARTVDVVLVTAADLVDMLLPAGNLREPITALRRADAVVIRQDEWTIVAPKVRAIVRERTPMWSIERTLRFPASLGVFSAGLRPVGFCAIARPEGFAQMLTDAGCGLIEMLVFGDHHGYTMDGIKHIVHVATGLKASGFVTTEKDAVKLSPEMLEQLERVGPVVVIALETKFLNTAEVLSDLEERLG